MTSILFHFDCEITLESVPETNRYQAMSVTVPCIMKQQKPLMEFESTVTSHFPPCHAAPPMSLSL